MKAYSWRKTPSDFIYDSLWKLKIKDQSQTHNIQYYCLLQMLFTGSVLLQEKQDH